MRSKSWVAFLFGIHSFIHSFSDLLLSTFFFFFNKVFSFN